ncbi:MAG: XisI protein [bacterium]|nr:XisI protein [bacterium]
MDTVEIYRQKIEKILVEYTLIPYAHGDIQSAAVFDRERDRYLLVNVGWDEGRRVHGTLVHVDVIAGRIWIQRDGTEDGVANGLVAAGVPKEHIVLGFHAPEMRPYTEFAAA